MKSPHLSGRIYKFIGLAFLFFSCASDLDIEQIKDIRLQPVFVTNLAFFDVSANKLIDDGTAQEIAVDIQPFKIFKEKLFKNNLVKTELNFEIENTINRQFSIDFVLYDKSDEVLQTITFDVPAHTGGSNLIKYPTEVFEKERLVLLKKTVKIGFTFKIAAGPALDENSTGNLKLRSGATAYMEFE